MIELLMWFLEVLLEKLVEVWHCEGFQRYKQHLSR